MKNTKVMITVERTKAVNNSELEAFESFFEDLFEDLDEDCVMVEERILIELYLPSEV